KTKSQQEITDLDNVCLQPSVIMKRPPLPNNYQDQSLPACFHSSGTSSNS
ncbi:unnamed protein product, partial [Brachionus calyciflorus]